MVSTSRTKSTFASNVKDGSMIKLVPYFIIYTHTPLKVSFLAIYLYFVLWPECSLREVSLESVVPYHKCYRFIRTVMEKISSSPSSSSSTKLGGNVEGDEFYIKAGLKGRSYHDEIVK
jgi:hypothetical protein